ncbi:hypothetical protein GDO81_013500 [Engystomops pustulosus]|uniref:Uncharacterized protein n=1 Tax=Engystomops pustulosus TaxID=76066 RepID=A0AAV7B3X3_ENGPU|nr:hypothetical protein GDO81_013500 [Engystomops pustulosus]
MTPVGSNTVHSVTDLGILVRILLSPDDAMGSDTLCGRRQLCHLNSCGTFIFFYLIGGGIHLPGQTSPRLPGLVLDPICRNLL